LQKNNRLYFAGEACSPEYISSVPAAYMTGIDAANKILSIEANINNQSYPIFSVLIALLSYIINLFQDFFSSL
jgi:hypothetical protein